MVLTVVIAAALVGRMSAVPILALTWVIPAALHRGATLTAAADAFLAACLVGALGVLLRVAYGWVTTRTVTARA